MAHGHCTTPLAARIRARAGPTLQRPQSMAPAPRSHPSRRPLRGRSKRGAGGERAEVGCKGPQSVLQLKHMSVTAAESVLQLSHAPRAFHAGRGKPGNPADQGSQTEIHRIKVAQHRSPSDQGCSAETFLGSKLLSGISIGSKLLRPHCRRLRRQAKAHKLRIC